MFKNELYLVPSFTPDQIHTLVLINHFASHHPKTYVLSCPSLFAQLLSCAPDYVKSGSQIQNLSPIAIVHGIEQIELDRA